MTSKPVVSGGALWNSAYNHTAYEEPFDPNNCGDWVMVSDNEYFRCYEKHMGGGAIYRKTECKGTEQMLEDNRREYNESDGKRWGDGKSVARIPMNVLFQSGWAEATKQGDVTWKKKFLNDPDNRKFRIWKGRV
jgi:hypothetical protein